MHRAPFELFQGEDAQNMRLYVRGNFTMDDPKDFFAKCLNFLDCEDLLLNVSVKPFKNRVLDVIRKILSIHDFDVSSLMLRVIYRLFSSHINSERDRFRTEMYQAMSPRKGRGRCQVELGIRGRQLNAQRSEPMANYLPFQSLGRLSVIRFVTSGSNAEVMLATLGLDCAACRGFIVFLF